VLIYAILSLPTASYMSHYPVLQTSKIFPFYYRMSEGGMTENIVYPEVLLIILSADKHYYRKTRLEVGNRQMGHNIA